MDGRTFEIYFIRSTQRRPKNANKNRRKYMKKMDDNSENNFSTKTLDCVIQRL